MKAIIDSINERSKIKCAFHNIRLNFKAIRSYEKILSTDYLCKDIDTDKAHNKINSLINECVNSLSDIEPLCKIYYQLFEVEFNETKKALHKIAKRQPLTKIN